MRVLGLSACHGVRPRPSAGRGVAVLLSVPLLAGSAGAQGPAPCPPSAADALAAAERRLQQLDDDGARRALEQAEAAAGRCAEARVARLAVEGWVEARRLAQVGGDPAELGVVRGLLGQLAGMAAARPGTVDGQRAAYAEAVVRAAVAAAQDERDELALFLVHARSLADRLRLGGERAVWPLVIDQVEGELWLEVDRYPEAREAFRRAPATGRTLVGLARATERLGAPTEACLAWRRAASHALAELVRRQIDASVARLRCAPQD